MSCFDEGDCTATELGEMYMQAYQWGASQGGFSDDSDLGYPEEGSYSQMSGFWADAMGQYDDAYISGDPFLLTGVDNFYMNMILPEYGSYVYGMMPGEGIFQDYQDIQRAERMGSMKTQGLRDTFSRDLSSQRFAVGSTGLTGIGSGILNQQDLYSQFQLDAQAEAMQVEQAQNEIYGDLGEEISGDLDYLFDPGGGGVEIDYEMYEGGSDLQDWYRDQYDAGNIFMSSDGEFGSTMVPLDPGLSDDFAEYMSGLTQWSEDSSEWTGVEWGQWVGIGSNSYNEDNIRVSNEACAQFMFDEGYGNNIMDAMQYCTEYA
jgi:hypothetical protein